MTARENDVASADADRHAGARRRRRGLRLGLAATSLVGGAALASAGTPAGAATTTSGSVSCQTGKITFTYSGAEQCYAVPTGITQLGVVAVGASGGSNGGGGGGGQVTTTVTVPAGVTTLDVEVGGTGTGSAGGFNGGGNGGSGWHSGWGGGGASDIRTVSCGGACPGDGSSQVSRLVVAGGGGGDGGSTYYGYSTVGGSGGSGADGSGSNGSQGGAGGPNPSGYGGGGATQAAGGSAGSGNDGGANGGPGTSGSGGGGGGAFTGPGYVYTGGGGGGGGGYYGGGGGGGGGSRYTNQLYFGSGGSGGGGSSYGPSGSTFQAASSSTPTSVSITPVDNDLALAGVSPGITTDATSPSGAVVGYNAPTAVDEDGTSQATVSCSSPSGSTFAIGTTRVTCTATDPDDVNSSVTQAFNITVLGAADQLNQLALAVQGAGPGNSLAAKVSQAQADLAAGNTKGTCAVLGSFVSEVRAIAWWDTRVPQWNSWQSSQSGLRIPTAQVAAQLNASATQIENVLGC